MYFLQLSFLSQSNYELYFGCGFLRQGFYSLGCPRIPSVNWVGLEHIEIYLPLPPGIKDIHVLFF